MAVTKHAGEAYARVYIRPGICGEVRHIGAHSETLHRLLKSSTSDSEQAWLAVGEYRAILAKFRINT